MRSERGEAAARGEERLSYGSEDPADGFDTATIAMSVDEQDAGRLASKAAVMASS